MRKGKIRPALDELLEKIALGFTATRLGFFLAPESSQLNRTNRRASREEQVEAGQRSRNSARAEIFGQGPLERRLCSIVVGIMKQRCVRAEGNGRLNCTENGLTFSGLCLSRDKSGVNLSSVARGWEVVRAKWQVKS